MESRSIIDSSIEISTESSNPSLALRPMTDSVSRSKPTEFEERVYNHVRQIPCGNVQTYGQVALSIGNPNAARAVGRALKRNPFGPDACCTQTQTVHCHRVVPSNRTLGGYFGKSDKHAQATKRTRLEAEGVTFDDNGRVDSSHFAKLDHALEFEATSTIPTIPTNYFETGPPPLTQANAFDCNDSTIGGTRDRG